MASPLLMALGPFAFEAHGFGFTDLESQVSTPWARMNVVGGPAKPLQWTGGEGATKTIRGVLFPAALGGQGSLDGIVAAAQAGIVLPLVTLGLSSRARNIFGLWVVEGVRESEDYIDRFGEAGRNKYSIELRAFAEVGASLAQAAARSFSIF